MNKKLLLLYIFSVLFHSIQGQIIKHVQINWKIPQSLDEKSHFPDIWLFDPENYDYDGRQIYYTLNFAGTYADSNSLEIKNLKYSALNGNWPEKWIFNPIDRFQGEIFPNKGRENYNSHFKINTIIKKKNRWYKLESFDISFQTATPRPASRSFSIIHGPLSEGDWYRIEVEKTGIYKIDKNFLRNLGINPDQIDPRNIRIYGWGGRMLPLKNTPGYPLQIPELAIEVIGEQDGSFDDNDYILFYGIGKDHWNPEYQTHNNIYSDHAFYYIQIASSPGKRITEFTQPSAPATEFYNTYLATQFFEEDEINIAKLGREWYGQNFNQGNATIEFSFRFENLDINQPVRYEIKAATDNHVPSQIQIFFNGNPANPLNLPALNTYMQANSIYAVKQRLIDQINVNSENLNIKLQYNDGGYPPAKVYLDYFKVHAFCHLEGNGKSFLFSNPNQQTASGIVQYNLSNASQIQAIWIVTDPFNVEKITNPAGNSNFSFKDNPGNQRYHTVGNDFLTPTIPDKIRIENQDLSYETFYPDGNQLVEPQYIIIAPESFSTQARQIVQFHQSRGLNAFFAPVEKIYREFGNGMQDIAAIRNYIRYVYMNASSPATKLKYVTLLGDASWDFKKKQYPDLQDNINIIPSYESQESFSLVSSFVTDDFFACMDDNEGYMEFNSNTVDLSIGRIPVSTTGEAQEVINKILNYYNPETYGTWHNTVTLLSDDADSPANAWELGLLYSTFYISDKIKNYHPFIIQNKIYLDAYKQVSTSGGFRYPKAKQDLLNSFEKGTLMLNFIGHGNEYSWTHERVLNIPEIKNLRNKNKLPFVSTITCEFGRFDNPKLHSGAELFVLNPNGGAFQMITTTREVSAAAAMNINKRLYDFLLGTEGATFSTFRTPGEALFMSKQTYSSINKKICLFGDPAMPLHFAKPQVVITQLTGASNDTIKALQHIRVQGEVRNENNQLLSDYNGTLYPIVFDKEIQVSTRNNDNVPGQNFTFEKTGPVIFRGQAQVNNGQFSFEFIVPKDIQPHYDRGKINFYGKKGQNIRQGIDTTYTVGGIDTQAPEDNTPPDIQIFMNDYNFSDGGITDPNPFLLINLYDESGINTVGGVGHDIVAILDNSTENTFILNDYYTADSNTYKSGKIKFKLHGIPPGEHTIKVRAWDTYNNSGEQEIRFRVVESTELEISRVLNYPNPFIDYTEFWFTHNRPYETLDVQVQVYSVSGKLVWSEYKQIQTQGNTSREISWNGRDQFGQKIGKGVYFYKLSVRTQDGKTAEKWEKLVKL